LLAYERRIARIAMINPRRASVETLSLGRAALVCAAGLFALVNLSAMLLAEPYAPSGQSNDPHAPVAAKSDLSSGLNPFGSSELPTVVPTAIKVMPSRYAALSDALRGYQKTGISLVAFNGRSYYPAGAPDDPGSYYLIPRLSSLLNLSLDRSIDLFYFSVLALAFVIGTVGFFAGLSTKRGKWLGLLWLGVVGSCAYQAGDVYVVSTLPVAVVPWLLYLPERHYGWSLPVFLFAEGMVIGLANTIRAHSVTALLILTLCILFFRIRARTARKGLLVFVLLIGLAVPQVWLRELVGKRDVFLATACPNCPKIPAEHLFWHPTYLGFSFLTNPYVPAYDDALAYRRVQAVAPGAVSGSAEYEHVLRREVLALVRHHPVFVTITFAAKTGVIIFVVVAVANIGLLAGVLYRKPWPVEIGFWLAIAYSSLPGLLAIPSHSGYMLGLVTFASLYAVVSTDFALSNGAGEDLRNFSRRHMLAVRHAPA
jgi:hypothetical protein